MSTNPTVKNHANGKAIAKINQLEKCKKSYCMSTNPTVKNHVSWKAISVMMDSLLGIWFEGNNKGNGVDTGFNDSNKGDNRVDSSIEGFGAKGAKGAITSIKGAITRQPQNLKE